MSTSNNWKNSRLSWFRHVIESRSASAFGLALVVAMGLIGYTQVVPNAPVVAVILLVILYEFQKRLDQGVPLLQLTSLLAVLQWIVGPILNYSINYSYGRYSMYVDEQTYFQFALPATAAYVALMLLAGVSIKQRNLFQGINRSHFVEIGVLLNIAALAAAYTADRVGGSLAFLMHLISQLRYVGALYFLFSKNQLRLLLAIASCSPLVTRSLGSGMFHDLILWIAILFCFWFAQRKWKFQLKIIILVVAAFFLFSIQVIKQDYRQQLRLGKSPAIFPLICEYVIPGGKAWSDVPLSLVVTRLNQGWIISAVMKNVPAHEPFANGQTIKDAFVSSALPRFLYKDKKTAGGRDNFRRYTGLDIQDSTSMAISPLGEAYANFGRDGGILFMFAFGIVFAVIYRGALHYTLKNPTFLFWIPLIFYQAIKAETELLVVMNQIVKGSIVAFGCHYLIISILPSGSNKTKQTQTTVVPSANVTSQQNSLP
jgi:hypothetical protein